MANIKVDVTDFIKKSTRFGELIKEKTHLAVNAVADEVLRLSQFEVPHDTGRLQNSGHVEPGEDELHALVGYNTVYAARLHENPQYHFQKGRKGKYLEDPIKNNIDIFRSYIMKIIGEAF